MGKSGRWVGLVGGCQVVSRSGRFGLEDSESTTVSKKVRIWGVPLRISFVEGKA